MNFFTWMKNYAPHSVLLMRMKYNILFLEQSLIYVAYVNKLFHLFDIFNLLISKFILLFDIDFTYYITECIFYRA